jgi:hypothetical protein
VLAGIGITLITAGAHAQGAAPVDLSQLVVSSDALGDGWVLTDSGPDSSLNGFSPRPTAAYRVSFSQPPLSAEVVLTEYPNRATALASPGLTDSSTYWGHGAGGFDPTTTYGDGSSYRIYPIGKAADSAITFIDGNVLAFVSVDGFDSEPQADAAADQLASAEDALLQASGSSAPATSLPSVPANTTPVAEPSPTVETGLSWLKSHFSGQILVPPSGLQPFAGLQLSAVNPVTNYPQSYSLSFVNPADQQNQFGHATATVEGAMSRQMLDDTVTDLRNRYNDCAPAAAYCAHKFPPCTGLGCDAQGEVFRIMVRGQDALLEHVQDLPFGWSWVLTWFDPTSGVTYRLTTTNGADPGNSDNGLSSDNQAAARQLADVAQKLVPLSP